MKTDLELASLMARYQTGDLVAAQDLIEELSPVLYKLFAIQTLSREYADDLMQETWLRIHKIRHTYRPGERVLPWLYAIARNVRVDHYRRTRRVSQREQAVEGLSERAPDPHSLQPSSEIDFANLLAQLPESQREAISMLKISGMSLEDIARATSSTVGAVKQRVHRGYERLRVLLMAEKRDAMAKGDSARG